LLKGDFICQQRTGSFQATLANQSSTNGSKWVVFCLSVFVRNFGEADTRLGVTEAWFWGLPPGALLWTPARITAAVREPFASPLMAGSSLFNRSSHPHHFHRV
tara:strand:- start:31716 stop:32024 length:309 start_codon:yes stop_codon:yes gene_type:complete